MFALILFILIILFGLIIVEIFYRKFSIQTTLSRKIVHILSSLLVFIMPFFLVKNEIIILSTIFAILFFLTHYKNVFSSINSVERKTFGEIFFPLGVILCALFFLPQNVAAFQFGILTMGICDALASIFGEKFGKHIIKMFGHKKSLEGSAVFLISNIIITLLFVNRLDYRILLVSFILTLIELFSVIGLDNFILPTAGAYLIKFLI